MAAEAATARVVHAILRGGRVKIGLLLQDFPPPVRAETRSTAETKGNAETYDRLSRWPFLRPFQRRAVSNLCFRCRMTLSPRLVEAILCSIPPTETRHLPLS